MTFQYGSWPQSQAAPAGFGVPGVVPDVSMIPNMPQLDPGTGLPAGAEHRDLAYHRLGLSDHKHRAWLPLLEGLVLIVSILIFTIIFFFIFGLLFAIFENDEILNFLENGDINSIDLTSPTGVILLFGSIAIWVPIILGVRWLFRPRPVGLIWSVEGRIRWKWLLITGGIAAAIFVVIMGGGSLVVGLFAPDDAGVSFANPAPTWVVSMLLIFLIVPIQCTAEELAFRGYLAQSIGRWLKNPAWAILLPAPLFMLGHLYDVWGQLSVLCMAIIGGFITWRTGGLEAAISLHVVNNIFVSIAALFFPSDYGGGETESIGFLGFFMAVLVETMYAFIVIFLAKRMNIVKTRHAVVWPKKYQDIWYNQVNLAYQSHYGGGYAQSLAAPYNYGPVAPGGTPALVPATIPASMAYADPHQINSDGSLWLVPADGLIAYASTRQEQIPGSHPPAYAHPVVWMARPPQHMQQSQPAQYPYPSSGQQPESSVREGQ